jgi:mRNA-degrading endonuclease toxin of MazEF toxin-antitoxin module
MMPSSFQMGQIVWATVADARGYRKLRPAVIVTPSERIRSTGSLDVIAVTSRLPDRLPPDHVLLPWHPQRHPRTGLNRKCAAVCSWMIRISPDDIQDVAGVLPGTVLLDIIKRVAAT